MILLMKLQNNMGRLDRDSKIKSRELQNYYIIARVKCIVYLP